MNRYIVIYARKYQNTNTLRTRVALVNATSKLDAADRVHRALLRRGWDYVEIQGVTRDLNTTQRTDPDIEWGGPIQAVSYNLRPTFSLIGEEWQT